MRKFFWAIPAIAALWGQPQSGPPAVLHDPPRFRVGQIEAATDGGAHSSAGMAGKAPPALAVPPKAPAANETALRRTARERPGPLGQFLLEAGRAPEALPFLRAALRLQPESLPLRRDLIMALIETRELAESRTLLTALQKAVSTPGGVNLEAQWLAASSQPVEAARLFQQAAEAEPSERNLFDWGNHLLTHGAADPAVKIFRYAGEKFPQAARLKVALGVALYAQGEFAAAVRAVCEGVDLDPHDLRPLVFLGQMVDVSPEGNEQLAQRLAKFAALYPDNAQAQYFYGLTLLPKPEAAEPYLRRAAKLDTRYAEPRLALGKLHADAGRDREAIAELEAAVALAPDSDAAHYRLGQLYQRGGDAARSARHFAAYRKLKAAKSEREEQERKQRLRLSEKQ